MQSKGYAYEDLAAQHLSAKGYRLKAKNYHTRRGEIDLIFTKGSSLIFVEVRYRKSSKYGSAEESITKNKQTKIIFSAKHYITKYNLWHMNTRFDVITFAPNTPNNELKINWLQNAFST